MQVYLTILPKDRADRKTMHKSASQILQLHEELLIELQTALGKADHSQEIQSRPRRIYPRHTRWRSMDSPPPAIQRDQVVRHSIDTSRPRPRSFMADTQLVVGIAMLFDEFVSHRSGQVLSDGTDATIPYVRGVRGLQRAPGRAGLEHGCIE